MDCVPFLSASWNHPSWRHILYCIELEYKQIFLIIFFSSHLFVSTFKNDILWKNLAYHHSPFKGKTLLLHGVWLCMLLIKRTQYSVMPSCCILKRYLREVSYVNCQEMKWANLCLIVFIWTVGTVTFIFRNLSCLSHFHEGI